MTYCKNKPVFCGCQPNEGWPCPYEPPAQGEPKDYDALIAHLLRHANEGNYRHIPICEAADALAALRAENERQAREIAAIKDERKDWARTFMLDGRTPWEWENACKRAETSESAWKILCGGKQKIIDALETERAVWKDKAETRGRAGCEARAKLAQAKRIIAAADSMRKLEQHRGNIPGCVDCAAVANYDRERAEWKP